MSDEVQQPSQAVMEATRKAVGEIEAGIYERRLARMLVVVGLATMLGIPAWLVGRFDQLAAFLDRFANDEYSR